jgi:signal transduction histidine kinase
MSRRKDSMLPSEEFINLCQLQVGVLTEQLEADWSAVYLTAGLGGEDGPKLLRVFSYPLSYSGFLGQKSLPEATEEEWSLDKGIPREEKQVILPLLYMDRMLGLLVTGRETPSWQPAELLKMEKIAQTLAIACILDQRQQEEHQRNIVLLERLDNLLHQLRNPLTALRTFGKLLRKRLGLEVENQAIVQGILRESDRLKELLENFENDNPREFPQLNGTPKTLSLPAATLELEHLDIQEVLEPLVVSAQAIAEERQLNLTAEIPTTPTILGNKGALREAISNLLDNALKYTPAGGEVSLRVELEAEQGRLGVMIADTGYGIPPQAQEHLFERHYRGIQASSQIPGSGLGLAIAKDLVEQMHGTIEVISPNPQTSDPELPGTIFQIWLSLS